MVIHDNNDTGIPREQAEILGKELHVEPVFVDAAEEHFDAKEEPSLLSHIVVPTEMHTTSTVAEIKSFIADIVGVVLQRYEAAGSTVEEAIETIKQEFALDELPIDPSKVRNVRGLTDQLIEAFEKTFDKKIQGADPRAVDATLRAIYLAMIDKYRIAHIDDMQYLRDKVGLYGYAQQDPLIIYKKEAFDKFEQLLFNIKQETIGIIFRTDFTGGQ